MEEAIARFAEWGPAGILLALFLGTFVSEDLACLSAGSLAAAGRVDLAAAIAICFAGIFVGDMALYAAGRVCGPRVLSSRLVSRFVDERSLKSGERWLRERGAAAVFVSRFASGLRLPTYVAAGVLRMDPKRFAVYFASAAAVWTPLLVGTAALWQMAVPGNVIVALIAAFVLFRFAFRMTSWKNRRLFLGRLRRIARWEFWPPWLFYVPVGAYVLMSIVRHRGLAFTAANPSMPAGGFVGESKDEIYKLVSRSRPAEPHLLRHAKFDGDLDAIERCAAAPRFIEANSLSFPVVVKPDAGERGDGVTVVRGDRQLFNALTEAKGDVLVQEHYDGVEASIFYCRRPGDEHGRVFSITEKEFPAVTGNGVSTLEELILRDDRAYIVAARYFAPNRDRLHDVPAAGERVRLVEIGSHSKGAIFRDGGRLRTPELEAKIDEICRGVPGFFFGRFDIRAASFEDLKLGRDFRIIELNGVTSESTNIYDPRYTLRDAYRILFEQWRLAFEIGAANARLGAKVTTVRDLLQLIAANTIPRFLQRNVRPLHRPS